MTIIARDIGKSYTKRKNSSRSLTAVKTSSITLQKGGLTAIFGCSGSGKTTLLNLLSGLLKPSEGQVLYDGRDIYAISDRELSAFRCEHIGYIPQGQSMLGHLTVRENVLLPAVLLGRDASQYADELIKSLGLTELADVYPHELSGGELRRAAIARALINSPEAVFADEPTNDLDDDNTRLILELLKRTALSGRTVVVVTHEPSAAEFADTVYRMDKGRLTIERSS